jgi:hypothetical protein
MPCYRRGSVTRSPAFPQCAHRPGAVLHKRSTWLCTAKPVARSRAGLADSGPACRCLREAAGTQDADPAWARMPSPTTAGTGCSPRTLRDRRPASPRRLPAVTLIVILPAARPRYAHAARAQPPPALAPRPVPARPRAGAGGAGPHRRPGSAADYRPGNGRCRGAGPRRRPCSRRRGTQSCGLELRRVPHGPGAGPARTVREPRPCPAGPPIIAAFLRSPGCRPRQDVPAGQNQARPLHV